MATSAWFFAAGRNYGLTPISMFSMAVGSQALATVASEGWVDRHQVQSACYPVLLHDRTASGRRPGMPPCTFRCGVFKPSIISGEAGVVDHFHSEMMSERLPVPPGISRRATSSGQKRRSLAGLINARPDEQAGGLVGHYYRVHRLALRPRVPTDGTRP